MERIRALSTDRDKAVPRPERRQGPGLQRQLGLGTGCENVSLACSAPFGPDSHPVPAPRPDAVVSTHLLAVPVPLAFTCGALPTPPLHPLRLHYHLPVLEVPEER